jgi:hypothetical protein
MRARCSVCSSDTPAVGEASALLLPGSAGPAGEEAGDLVEACRLRASPLMA